MWIQKRLKFENLGDFRTEKIFRIPIKKNSVNMMNQIKTPENYIL